MRKYVDTHCHLDKLYKLLKKPFGSAMEEWGEGLDGCVSVPLLSLGESALNATHPKIKFAVGVHPLRARELTARMEARLCRFARMPQVCLRIWKRTTMQRMVQAAMQTTPKSCTPSMLKPPP